jgi:peptidoglycan hydrolase CwlO-like protein
VNTRWNERENENERTARELQRLEEERARERREQEERDEELARTLDLELNAENAAQDPRNRPSQLQPPRVGSDPMPGGW